MVQSMNHTVDLTIKATSLMGLTSVGNMMVGDCALEYYNESNPNDFIQIPWGEVDHIAAEVLFNRKIARFAVFTKRNGTYKFSTRDNIKTLCAVREHFPEEKMLRSPNVIEVMKRGILSIPKAVSGHRAQGGGE